ncbi:MAG: hypothetical protein KDA20_05455 [Phycisphaerales bacterium]|nr:hypothetical protein [Phycisphaerales bacterium]
MRRSSVVVSMVVLAGSAIAFAQSKSQSPPEVAAFGETRPSAFVEARAVPSTAFSYQGNLTDGGSPVTTPVDLRFHIWNDAAAGSEVGTAMDVSLTPDNGNFAAQLDFGVSPYTPNQALWLEVEVSPAGAGTYTSLGRQAITATPYALNTRGIKVNSGGGVGIGTDPFSPFHVVTPTQGNVFQIVDFPPFVGTKLMGFFTADGAAPQVRFEGAGGFVDIGQLPGGAFVVEQVDIPVLVAAPDGNIGVSTSNPAARVHAIATTGTGVRGEASNTTGTFGVYGQCLNPSGWGVFSNGRLGASGTKSFMIDHPLDPTGKYLLHYSSEAPEPQNRYNGNVVLDSHGVGTVALPDYFQAINADFRYTLTPIGAPAPNLYVAQEVNNNTFVIAGGAAGQKVSWEVIARRNDAFVAQRGAPVEVQKVGAERGRLLMPELYGLPAEQGIGAIEPSQH